MAAALLVVPGARRRVAVGRAARSRAAVRSCSRAARRWSRSACAWPLLVCAHAGGRPRPWISGTSDNSIWSLILGYNGLGRLDGQAGGPRRRRAAAAARAAAARSAATPGPLRLLNEALGGQAGWLLGFALVGGARAGRRDAACAAPTRARAGCSPSAARSLTDRRRVQLRQGHLPPLLRVAARAVHRRAGRRRRGAAAPGDALARVARRRSRSPPACVDRARRARTTTRAARLAAPLLVVGRRARRRRARPRDGNRARARRALAAALGALLIAPATWSVQTLGHATSGTFPAGGPARAAGGGGGPGGGRGGFGGGPPARLARRRRAPTARAGGAPGGRLRRPAGAGGAAACSAATRVAHRRARLREAHGGGTIAVSSQSGASASIITPAPTSRPSAASPAARARSASTGSPTRCATGKIRWVLTDGRAAAWPATAGPAAATVMARRRAELHARQQRLVVLHHDERPLRLPGQGGRARRPGRERVVAAAEGPAGRRPLRPPYHPPR